MATTDNQQKEIFLAVDCGNTRLKATVLSESDVLGCVCVETPARVEDLLDFFERHHPETGAMVSVGPMDIRLVETIRNALEGDFLLLTHSTPLPVSIGYTDPRSLGLDRVAAVCGAEALYPGETVVVADAGTAMTVDLLTADGCFKGGSITAGMTLRYRALNDYTARLPLIDKDDTAAEAAAGEVSRWGADTRSAIIAGVAGGMADQLQLSMPDAGRLLLTGGDAGILYEILKRRLPVEKLARVAVEPALVAIGLRHIYKEYEKTI